MQTYENMSKVVHRDFSLKHDFSNVLYLYIFTVEAFNCPSLRAECHLSRRLVHQNHYHKCRLTTLENII